LNSSRSLVEWFQFLIFPDELEISAAAFKRDPEYFHDRMNMSIERDRDAGVYRYTLHQTDGHSSKLPGMWFNASEVHALLTMQHLFANLGNRLLSTQDPPPRKSAGRYWFQTTKSTL